MAPLTPQRLLWISTAIPLLFFFLTLAFDRQNLRSVGFLTLAVSVPVLQSLLFAGFLDKIRRALRNGKRWYILNALLNVSLTTIFTNLAWPSDPWRACLFGGYTVWGFCVDHVFGPPPYHSFQFCAQSLTLVFTVVDVLSNLLLLGFMALVSQYVVHDMYVRGSI